MAAPARAVVRIFDLSDDVLLHVIGALARKTLNEVPMETSPGWWFQRRHQSRLTTPRLVSTHLRGVFDAWWRSDPHSRLWQQTAQRTIYGVLVGRCTVSARDLVLPRIGPPPRAPTNRYLMAIQCGANTVVHSVQLEPSESEDDLTSEVRLTLPEEQAVDLVMADMRSITLFIQRGNWVVAVARFAGLAGDEDDVFLDESPIEIPAFAHADMTAAVTVTSIGDSTGDFLGTNPYQDVMDAIDPNVLRAMVRADLLMRLETVALVRADDGWRATRHEEARDLRLVGVAMSFHASALYRMERLVQERISRCVD